MTDESTRYVLITNRTSSAASSFFCEEDLHRQVIVSLPEAQTRAVIAAGSLEACRAAGRLLLEVAP